ncbi:YqcC family protein [Bacillus subtilis subsp. subtilis]|nr:YqcC family protein [Bacillus subtilis subsp. subtilis]
MGLPDFWKRPATPAVPLRDTLVDQIEQALRDLGWLQGAVGAPRHVDSAFGIDEMPFEHWLVQVFLPRLHEARRDRQWPSSSQVAVAARRNLDGQQDGEPLLHLLAQLDHDINTGGTPARGRP